MAALRKLRRKRETKIDVALFQKVGASTPGDNSERHIRIGEHGDVMRWLLSTTLAQTPRIGHDPSLRATYLIGCNDMYDIQNGPDTTES